MTLAPLLAAPAIIQLHAFAAMAAFVLGIVQFASPKGTLPHRSLGWLWVLLMLGVAISSFWITSNGGHYSWIHGLSAFSLIALTVAVLAARRHKVRTHQRAMVFIFIGALAITGLFTLLSGRIMNRVVFGS
jgi:uncharacterized membrane protein